MTVPAWRTGLGVHLHTYAAVLMTSVSGTLMILAGMAYAEAGWGSARPFALAGGVAIQAALFTERRGVRTRGVALAGRLSPLLLQAAASALILATGLALVLMGYGFVAAGPWPLAIAMLPILTILVPAAQLNRRAAAVRMLQRDRQRVDAEPLPIAWRNRKWGGGAAE